MAQDPYAEFQDAPVRIQGRPRVAPPRAPEQTAQDIASANAANANANRTQAMTPVDRRGQELQNQNLDRNLQLPAGMSDATVNQARDRVNAAQMLLSRLDDAEARFAPYEGQTSLGEIAGTVLPYTDGLDRFDSASTSMISTIRRLYRTPDGSTTNREGQYYEGLVPSPRERDSVNRDRINRLREELRGQLEFYTPLLPQAEQERVRARPLGPYEQGGRDIVRRGLEATRNPNLVQPGESMGQVGNLPPPSEELRSQNMGQNVIDAQGGAMATPDDIRLARERAAHLTAMARQGATFEQMDQWLGTIGHQPLPPQERRRIQSYRARGRGGDFPGFAPEVNPTSSSGPANILGRAADTDIGAGVTRFAGAMGGDLLGLVSEDYRNATDALRGRHPGASLVGDIAGSILPSAAIENLATRGLSRAGFNGTRMAPRIASNAAYSGMDAAALADPGNRLEAGLLGGTIGAAGGEAGNALTRTLGAGVRGIQNAPTRYLNGQGVPQTIGELGRSAGGVVGRGLARVEDAATSVPILGDLINMGRMHGRRGLNQAAFRQGIEPVAPTIPGQRTPIGDIGTMGVGQGQQQVGMAYDNALQGRNIPLDAQYGADMADARTTAAGTGAEQLPRFDAATNYIDNQLAPNGQMTGPQYQAAMQVLARERAGIDGGMAHELRGAFGEASNAVAGAANRAAPDIAPALNAANTANRNMTILGNAVNTGKNQAEEMFTASQLRNAAVRNTEQFGGNNLAHAGGEPFNDLTTAAQAAQGNGLPDSGTAGRAMLGVPLLAAGGAGVGYANDQSADGAGSGAAKALGAGGLAALLYSRGGQRILQRLLAGERAPPLRALGNGIDSNWGRRAGSALGRSPLAPLVQNSLPDLEDPRYQLQPY